jgi:hypothetical protein
MTIIAYVFSKTRKLFREKNRVAGVTHGQTDLGGDERSDDPAVLPRLLISFVSKSYLPLLLTTMMNGIPRCEKRPKVP